MDASTCSTDVTNILFYSTYFNFPETPTCGGKKAIGVIELPRWAAAGTRRDEGTSSVSEISTLHAMLRATLYLRRR